jgi:hypothetical protein
MITGKLGGQRILDDGKGGEGMSWERVGREGEGIR